MKTKYFLMGILIFFTGVLSFFTNVRSCYLQTLFCCGPYQGSSFSPSEFAFFRNNKLHVKALGQKYGHNYYNADCEAANDFYFTAEIPGCSDKVSGNIFHLKLNLFPFSPEYTPFDSLDPPRQHS